MNLNLLKVFDVVMRERSITRAADRLCITQSAVSNGVARLRRELNDDLFVRTPTGVTPTAKSYSIWPYVRTALRQVDLITAQGDFDPRHAMTSFTFAASDYAQHYLLPPFIKYVLEHAPQVELNFRPYAIDRVEDMLRGDEINIATGIFPSLSREFPNMVIEVIPYVCVMRKGHALARDSISIDDFARARHLRISVADTGTSAIEGHLEGYGIRRIVGLTLNQISLAPRIVAETDLLALLPQNIVEVSRYADALHVMPTPVPIPGNQVMLVWHSRNEDVASHTWLRNNLVRCVKTYAGMARSGKSISQPVVDHGRLDISSPQPR